MSLNEDDARRLDEADPGHRDLFYVPPAEGGRYPEVAYMAGNSLGLQPRATRAELLEDLDAWAQLGVEGHLDAKRPWLPYHELLTEPAARLVGALPTETVIMNSLTVNLHLLMVSFYRPTPGRDRILVEDTAFPSDSYAVRSQARFHGLDPDTAVARVEPGRIAEFLEREGDSVALVLLGGVNYLTGELMDIPALTTLGHSKGAIVGWDLAHAAGNVPLSLHEWGVDFAAWCSYKYLNSGPGALAGAFVHERHLDRADLQRFEGWWSTDPATRFKMAPVATPLPVADAWQISNPPIFAMGPVRTSLEIFDRVGMSALRQRSERLTGFLADLLDSFEVVTPANRGCQLSVRVAGGAGELSRRLRFEHGVVADAREPDIMRLAPVPLYSSYHDCWRAAEALRACL
ncbi:kynureninase [Rhizocola hellebori]|uniref:Kynureninase n=1 Tax=Rhizocola hellebori TaxID=1392758 RepID=A0A8J3QGM0_9ACTN|nr:kynureninase [Rhizocola hellebori]GIH09289.1 kynureninase [Rhizocola hellebori]